MSYLLKGGLVVTFDDKTNRPVAFKADVLVEGSTIAKVEEGIQVASGVEVIDCTGKWITPGMIDLHRHIWMAVLKASQGDMLLGEYFVKNSWNIQADVTTEEVRIGQLAGCLDALHNGVTTSLDHFHAVYSPEIAEVALEATVQSGARVVFCPSRASAPTKILPEFEWGREPQMGDWQMEKLREWAKKSEGGKLDKDGRVTLGLGYDILHPGNIPESQEIVKEARTWPAAIITAHVVHGPQIKLWKDSGMLGPDVVFSHCNLLSHRTAPDDEMWAAMKECNAGIGATPVDELGMSHGNPVAFEAVRRGVKAGLGVDAVSINSGDMFSQMRVMLQWQRGQEHEKILSVNGQMPKLNHWRASDAFRLVTLGGAEALNLSHIIGTITPGKKADIVIYDAESPNLAASFDPFLGIVFHASDADIEIVMVDGEILKRDRKLVKFEWKKIAKELKEASQGLHKRWPTEVLDEKWTEFYAQKGTPEW